ncbi:hypothetical protein NHX12_027074 [Muraenolepis orangiensis]|uniref:Uncharacterized protein n=1 Tax=Muraenolepis orangiensis TaxID=630683 RepID=A0A9Q0INX7_9TELE|nr:hypothetical protein NHX12_027074 [Muraenolepis orangiensis]
MHVIQVQVHDEHRNMSGHRHQRPQSQQQGELHREWQGDDKTDTTASFRHHSAAAGLTPVSDKVGDVTGVLN